jgi:hypothetical protein
MRALRKIGISIVVCIGILILILGTLLESNQTSADISNLKDSLTPSQVVQKYWDLVTEGSVSESRNLLTNSVNIPGTNEYMSAEIKNEIFWDQIIQKEGSKIRKIKGEKQKGSRAVVILEVLKSDGDIEELECRMVKIMDEWKIYTIGRHYSPDDPMCKIPGICNFLQE